MTAVNQGTGTSVASSAHDAKATVTVLIPTRNEAGNAAPLLAALQIHLAGHEARVLFVDDSSDETPQIIERLAVGSAIPVRVLHRPEGQRTGGLGGAVAAGLAMTTTEFAVVMDGDLQHPPAVVPLLLEAVGRAEADVVVASRHLPGGAALGLAHPARVAVSRAATMLARLAFPRRLRPLTDPMSGFFAVRLDALAGRTLTGCGFKILLEILLGGDALRVAEVPFEFGERHSGSSKASWREAWRYAALLGRLRVASLRRTRWTRWAGMGMIGVSGIAANMLAYLLFSRMGVHYTVAAVLATQVSTAWNFVLTDRIIFSGQKRYGLLHRALPYWGFNELALLVRVPLLVALIQLGWMSSAAANFTTLIVLFGARAVLAERVFAAAAVLPQAPQGQRPLDRLTTWRWLLPAAGGAVAVLAVVLRLTDLMKLGYNSDEAVYVGQGASLAGNPDFTGIFPVFRAHPLLFQSLVSLFMTHGASDVPGRLLSAAVGVAAVGVVFLIGRSLYGNATGVLAAAVIAAMPYHVIVSRQALLDGPMALFAAVTVLFLAYYAKTGRMGWLVAAGGALGLAALAKETALVLAGGSYLFLVLAPGLRRRLRGGVLAAAVTGAVFATYPLALRFAGHTSTGRSYLVWQLIRRPNHTYLFYGTVLPAAMGYAVIAAALLAIWQARRRGTWREWLLVSWIAVPLVFFELWPVKGYQYLLPTAPAVAVLAARGVASLRLPQRWATRGSRWAAASVLRIGCAAGLVLSVAVPSGLAVASSGSATFLAGTGGVAGGREAGEWLAVNVPAGSQLLTLGPSMANILQYYGHRRCYGLSVSSNPLHRNPSYEPVANPDLELRDRTLQYVVWDAYSAARSPTFAGRELQLVNRFHGRVIHVESVAGAGGASVPVIVIYEVRP